MRYIEWQDTDILDLYEEFNVVKIYTEIDDAGIVCREIGIDEHGKIAHKFPSENYQHGRYGLFDNQVVECEDEGINKSLFDDLWDK